MEIPLFINQHVCVFYCSRPILCLREVSPQKVTDRLVLLRIKFMVFEESGEQCAFPYQ